WTPGHEGLEGNKKADEEARKASEKGCSRTQLLPKELQSELTHSRSAVRGAFQKRLKEKAKKEWRGSKKFKRLGQ
ncbi:hypothetical protein CPB83DRAFT_735569, partial [Crepidotus variabilis]